jgi:nucleoid DNA-binding protein
MANTMSKSELIQRIVDGHPNEIARKDVKGVIDAVAAIGHKELKKTGAFVVPGLAKFIVGSTGQGCQRRRSVTFAEGRALSRPPWSKGVPRSSATMLLLRVRAFVFPWPQQ